MVTTEWNRFWEHKANGLVRDVFPDRQTLDKLPGEILNAGKGLITLGFGLGQKIN